MELSIKQIAGESCAPIPELHPEAYVEAIREFLLSHTASSAYSLKPSQLEDEIHEEEEKSRAFVEEALGRDEVSVAEEATEWIGDGFSRIMVRLVRLSAQANKAEPSVSPFVEIDPDRQEAIRGYVFNQYLELAEVLAGKDGPSHDHYTLSPFWYHDAESAQHVLDENKDFGRANMARLLMHKPRGVEEHIGELREQVAEVANRFPQIPQTVVRRLVVMAPGSYENGLRTYAQEHAIVLDPGDQEIPDAGDFNKARRLGQEAVALLDDAGTLEDLSLEDSSIDPQDLKLREGLQKRFEVLVHASNRAWRQGDLPVSPEQADEDFRRALFAQFIGDFLRIHIEMGGIAADRNPVLYFDPEEISQIVTDNTDLPPHVLRLLMTKDLANPDAAIATYRARYAAIEASNPHLLSRDIERLALARAPIAPGKNTEELKNMHVTPAELIKAVRSHLTKKGRGNVTVPKHIKLEIQQLRPEVIAYFEEIDWSVDGMQIPEKARKSLIKKIEDFINFSERAFRDEVIPTRLADCATEERAEVYKALAENYMKIAHILGVQAGRSWTHSPVLNIGADELQALRTQYDWMDEWAFREVILGARRDIPGALARTKRLITDLTAWHPDLGHNVTARIAVSYPGRAAERAMLHVRKRADREFKRPEIARDMESHPSKPVQIYTHLRAKNKYGVAPANGIFDPETEQRIKDFRNAAASWVAAQETAQDMDGPTMKQFLDGLEFYVRASEILYREESYPRVIDFAERARISFVKAVYGNQARLNDLVASASANGKPAFRAYEFGFFHDAKYMETLWKQYDVYFPRHLVTYAALTAAQRPMDRLNELVEYRAELLAENPDLDLETVIAAVASRAKNT